MDEDIKTKRTKRGKKIMGYKLEAEPGTGWKTEQRGRRVKKERRQTMRGCHLIWNKQQNKLS